ncbi:MAG: hypothetical protein IAE90_03355 [Ignavibacteria bacterium]|nr:hypothetical protein [Ignavibacteria bacterium]
MLNDDDKYKALRDTLRSVPRVKAKSDFESRLMARIREAEKQPVHHAAPVVHKSAVVKSWWANLFRPAFAPALGLTVVLLITVVVYFAYFAKMNDSNPVNQQQFVSSTNQGDLVIYVKSDTSNYSSNYPREYSAANPDENQNRSSDFYYSSPHEMPSDFNARPDPKTTPGTELKPDRVSEEQRFEMQKGYEKDKEKGVDVKGEVKPLPPVMKKESLKKESKEDSKLSDEKKNIYFDDDAVKQEDKKTNAKRKETEKVKDNESEANDEIKQQTKDTNSRISRATKKDSTKTKDSDTEAEQKK